MPIQRQLLTIAAAFESLTGLTLICAPKATAVFILGAELNVVGVVLGRVCGMALVALGIACWGARTDSESAARSGTLKAITFYNAVSVSSWFFSPHLARLAASCSGAPEGFTSLWQQRLPSRFEVLRLPHPRKLEPDRQATVAQLENKGTGWGHQIFSGESYAREVEQLLRLF